MANPFSISNWNSIIERVNALAQNPPANTNCHPQAPLPLVTEPQVFCTSDVANVRTKLLSICPENRFEEPLTVISKKLFDEIEAAISKGWCNCKPNDGECCQEYGWAQTCYRITIVFGTAVPVLYTSGAGSAATKEACNAQMATWRAAVIAYAASHGVSDQLEFREPVYECIIPCG